MKSNILTLLLICWSTIFCHAQSLNYYELSEDLQVEQLTKNTYRHISYLNTDTWGKVGCNGMIVMNNNEALIFDTPANEEASAELINWVQDSLKAKVIGVVVTHFHWDCLGGLNSFHEKAIPSYASQKTITLAQADSVPIPQHGFDQSLELTVGDIKVINTFFGAGHTHDNVVSYVPDDKVLFGGCLIKSMGTGKGNLEDANTDSWPGTVQAIKDSRPEVEIVIPGHGKTGGISLLDYTIELFESE
ncbi:subclass B1 metallo-beta-lactamase [Fulvivirga sp. RKSG066]|uniref:subclass B1 metallo-beta-lactamase n=1 Tax=Fulvivirga aurantia TaxID=2529383 RepID=UPI0012BBF71B|nr:subclass B1 metallo-beta-lactamase [Fulvivirga aurantia]MTI22700.1 subclass B1 metallo-beta-lactamase [Fulvivirga aurantia]